MDLPAPSPSPVHRWLGASAWAGMLAAGASLMGLGVALGADVLEVRGNLPHWIWLTITLSVGALAVRHGYPDSLGGGRGLAGRVLGVVVFGIVIGAPIVGVIITSFPRPSGDHDALALLGGAGFLLVCCAGGHMRSVRIERYFAQRYGVPAGPGGLLPAPPPVEPAATYTLAAAGPALTAEEAERPAPAVEIRVLWGGDPIRVHHLAPPRAFLLGDAGADLAVDTEPFGAARIPLVLAGKGGVSVIAPRGATGMVHVATPAKHVPLAQAVAEGLAEPFDGVPGSTRIALVPGTKVTISLPSHAAGDAYRGAYSGDEGAQVALEIALVRAGRAVGREISPARVARGLALAAAVVGTLVGLPALMKPPFVPPDPDDDGISSDQMYVMAMSLQAAAEREQEEAPPQEHGPRGTFVDVAPPPSYGESRFLPERVLGDMPFGAADEVRLLGPGYFCWRFGWEHEPEPNGEDFRGAHDAACTWPVVTPFGLRSSGLPEWRDALGRDPGDLWIIEYERARRRTPPGPVAQALAAAAEVSVALESPRSRGFRAPIVVEQIEPVLRRHTRDFRRCYELGLEANPKLAGNVNLHVAVGLDGRLRARETPTSSLPDPRVRRCVVEAVDGLRAAPQSHALPDLRFDVSLRRAEPGPRPSPDPH